MLTATECIRKILDAATSDNQQAAIDALDDYATHYQLNKQAAHKAINHDMDAINMEEKRSSFPNALNMLP